MRSAMTWRVLGSLGLALSVGCAGQESEPSSTTEVKPSVVETTSADAVASLELESGHSVTFYEPVPGGLYLVERMMPGQKFALTAKESADALLAFASLRPGAPVPAALQAAYDRARALPGDTTTARELSSGGGQSASEQAAAPGLGTSKQALTSSSSATTFVNDNTGCDWGPQGSFCRVNWANGFWASYSPTTSALCIVDHYAGNGVTIQITVGTTITSTFQGAGTIAQYSLGTAGASTTRRIDITNASGDSFHVGCRWGV